MSLVLCLFFISALPVFASFPGVSSLHGSPRNSRPTSYQLQSRRKFLFLDSFRESSLSFTESIWAMQPTPESGGIGREWTEIGRMVPQRKVTMLKVSKSKVKGKPMDEPVVPTKSRLVRGHFLTPAI